MNRPTAILAALFSIVLPAFASAQSRQTSQPFAGIASPVPEPHPRPFEAVKSPTPLPSREFERYFTTDELGRVIVFYVSEPPADTVEAGERLPVIVYVQGSGSQSVFTRVEEFEKVRAAATGGQGIIRQLTKARAIVVIAEKPGVKFMERPLQPGSAEEASPEFRQEHTLPRWSAAVSAAMKASLTLAVADRSRVLVVGHSEGGLVACRVAADNPLVSHVAVLAGGGATQLFDLVELARQGKMCGSKPRQPDECVEWLMAQWDEVLKSPQSADEFFLGHPYRRWTTFLATSPVEELKRSQARVFIGQGTDDNAVYPPSADVLYSTLKSLGRDVTYSRVPGDHAFMFVGEDGKPKGDGWLDMHTRVVEWFLNR